MTARAYCASPVKAFMTAPGTCARGSAGSLCERQCRWFFCEKQNKGSVLYNYMISEASISGIVQLYKPDPFVFSQNSFFL